VYIFSKSFHHCSVHIIDGDVMFTDTNPLVRNNLVTDMIMHSQKLFSKSEILTVVKVQIVVHVVTSVSDLEEHSQNCFCFISLNIHNIEKCLIKVTDYV
jgi:hypothetical protein